MPSKLNNATLISARQARRLSLAEVSAYTKISENRLRQFERGDVSPSFNQLTKLGDLYNIPAYSFYSDNEPAYDDVLPDFRKASPRAADLSPRGLVRLWQVERRAKFVDEVSKQLGKNRPESLKLKRVTNNAVVQAGQLRANFDSWLSSRPKSLRFQGSREDVFSRQLRLYLEVHRCQTIVNSAPVEDYLGFFASPAKNLSILFVNREVRNEKRRLFTLAHETAHFVYDEQGISNPFVAKNQIEKSCNAFAAEFLAPDEMVLAIVDRASMSILGDVSRLVDVIASQTLLSRQAATLRLRELDIISSKATSQHLSWLSKLRRLDEPRAEQKDKPALGRIAAVGKKLSEVGVYAACTAAVALRARLVDKVDIERGLGISENLQGDVLSLAVKRYEASLP